MLRLEAAFLLRVSAALLFSPYSTNPKAFHIPLALDWDCPAGLSPDVRRLFLEQFGSRFRILNPTGTSIREEIWGPTLSGPAENYLDHFRRKVVSLECDKEFLVIQYIGDEKEAMPAKVAQPLVVPSVTRENEIVHGQGGRGPQEAAARRRATTGGNPR